MDRFYADVKTHAGRCRRGAAAVMLQNFRDTMAEKMNLQIFFNVLFAGVIAFGVVYNSARVSLSERERELASLRVLGFTRGEISLILLGELAVLTLAALPVGALIGYVLGRAHHDRIQQRGLPPVVCDLARHVAWSFLVVDRRRIRLGPRRPPPARSSRPRGRAQEAGISVLRLLNNRRVSTAVAVVAGLMAVALWPTTLQVESRPSSRGPLVVTVDEEGVTRVRDRFVVSAPLAGRVLRIELEPGDRGEARRDRRARACGGAAAARRAHTGGGRGRRRERARRAGPRQRRRAAREGDAGAGAARAGARAGLAPRSSTSAATRRA